MTVAFTPRMPATAQLLDAADLAVGLSADARASEVGLVSFDDVYAAHAAFVWRVIRAFGVPPGQVEDAVQDVFVVVHRRLREWEGRAAITTWLFAIARRVASSYRRKDRTRDGSARTQPLTGEPQGSSDTLAAMHRADAAATVFRILETLDEDKRMVFTLVELEQMSVPEVAKIVGCNLNTAYSRLRLARAAFESAVLAGGAR